MSIPVSNIYVDMIKAFRKDCDKLIVMFSKEEKQDENTFLKLWKSLNFSMVYDRKYSRHGMEQDFMNDTLQIAKLIMLHEHFSCGMMLMFGLYCLQDSPTGAIRLTHEEICYILRMCRSRGGDLSMKNTFLLTVLFAIFLKECAVSYVKFGREYDVEGQHRADMIFNNKYDFSDDEESPTSKNWVRNFTENLPKHKKDLETEYLQVKKQTKEEFPDLNLSLDIVEEDIFTTLLKALTKTVRTAQPKDDSNSIGSRRRLLKNRKMKTKHRYQKLISNIENESDEDGRPAKQKKKVCPRGVKGRYSLARAINDPDSDENSDNKDSIAFDISQIKGELPTL